MANLKDLGERRFDGCVAPVWANFVAQYRGQWYWEEALGQEDGMRFKHISLVYGGPDRYTRNTDRGWEKAYRLPALLAAQQPDVVDELPPVPQDETYFSARGDRTTRIRLEPSSISITNDKSIFRVYVSAETARVMAHDLIRMAMELERREAE